MPEKYAIIDDEKLACLEDSDASYDAAVPFTNDGKPALRHDKLNQALDMLDCEIKILKEELHEGAVDLASDYICDVRNETAFSRISYEDSLGTAEVVKSRLDDLAKQIASEDFPEDILNLSMQGLEDYRQVRKHALEIFDRYGKICGLADEARQDLDDMIRIAENSPKPLSNDSLAEYDKLRQDAIRIVCELDGEYACARSAIESFEACREQQGLHHVLLENRIIDEKDKQGKWSHIRAKKNSAR